ncbi:MAG: NADH-quinone oxidoreductase subunit NuoN [Actinobacteria bacterium]|nr:NADH-quinone oxidoreductase subunit NuoN [Actinomycetota bacterium]
MITFISPTLEYAILAPMLIVLAGALIGVLIEAFAPRSARANSQLFITLTALVLSLASLIRVRNSASTTAAMESVTFDGAGMLLQASILVISIIAVLLLADQENFTALASALPGSDEERASLQKDLRVTEIYPLTLFAVAGMMLFPVATDLITLFVALEVLSLPLYLLAGLSRRRRLMSQEAALKYFLLGAFSSAFFLMGIAYLYGYSASTTLAGIHAAVVGGTGNDIYLLLGIAFLSIGLLFKVGAVPFHAWSPDVYQGAPTAVTAFMAAATKVAAFGAMLRIFYVSFAEALYQWRPALIAIALITMVFGSLVAIAQRDVKRMLAYSSIAHAGFLLSGVIALNKSGLDASIFYLFAYGVATVGAFGIVTLVRDSAGEVTDLNRWSGLGKRSPWVATAFAGFLLAFAGIPLTSGFIGKFSIFSAAYESGSTAILITGVLSSAIAAFFYIRVIVLMFFKDPVEDGTSVVIPSLYTQVTIIVSAVVTFALGIYPTPLINFIQSTASFLR